MDLDVWWVRFSSYLWGYPGFRIVSLATKTEKAEETIAKLTHGNNTTNGKKKAFNAIRNHGTSDALPTPLGSL